jgi:FkbM family methyltransferase
LEYETIDENSIVFDIGGYKGQWASDIFSKYCCNVYIFEPVREFAEKIEKRYAKNSKIVCFPFGLGNKSITTEFSAFEDSSSLYKNKGIKTEVDLVNIMDFLTIIKIGHINLMKINIEGGEYDLLDCLIGSDYIKNIDNLQIQFHAFFPDAVARRKKIQESLAETHRITYNYEFVWENWERIIDNIAYPPPPHPMHKIIFIIIQFI